MTTNLKQAVIEHFEEINLNDEQLSRLSFLQENDQRVGNSKPSRAWLAVAAIFIVVWVLYSLPLGQSDLTIRIAEEVAVNHLKQRPLEVQGIVLAEVRPYFNELDFRLSETRMISPSDNTLLGGRYCSVQGIPAAQLRIEDVSGQSRTLYQAPYIASRFGDLPDVDKGGIPLEIYTRGLHVSLWVEKGLLFALTGE